MRIQPRLLFFTVLLSGTAPLLSVELLQNPDLATSLAGWSVPDYSSATWDSFGQRGGGSALVVSQPGVLSFPDASIQQCVSVQPGQSYAFGASLRLPAGMLPQETVDFFVDVRFYPAPGCTGAQVDQVLGHLQPAPPDTWAGVQRNATAPAGAVSALAAFGAAVFNPSSPNETVQVYVDDAFFVSEARCGDTGTELCLGSRFLVSGLWSAPTQGRSGLMHAVPATSDSGLFWFFAEDNLEVFVKVLDACGLPSHNYWVFAAGLTNVEVLFSVQDLVSGQTREYSNTAGTAFPPIQDTSAFATCP